MKEKILGNKKGNQDQVVLTDPATGNDVHSPDEIKRVSLDYLLSILKTKEPHDKHKELVLRRKEQHFERMEERIDNDLEEMPEETFWKVVSKLEQKPGNKYKFITKAGYSLKLALLNLYKIIWKSEKVPVSWQDSLVTQLPKSAQNSKCLDEKRHIHERDELSKLLSQIVLSHAKENIYKNMSMFQIAGKPGHRASEHLYVLKSVFAYYQSQNKGLLVTSFDLRRFFDSEDIFDCFNEIYSSNVKGKVYRLLFEMNKNTRIIIQTPVGDTQPKNTGPIVTQGSVEGPVLSSVSIDNGTNVTFVQSEVEVMYKSLKLGPTIFMDDLARMAATLASAQYGNNLMQELIEQKCLEFNCY